MVCGSTLEYLRHAENFACVYCGKTEQGRVACPKGHFVCDRCHGLDARKMIEDVAFGTGDTDPVAIAELMMHHPSLPMLGCEHAFIAAGALMAALKNSLWKGQAHEHGHSRGIRADVEAGRGRVLWPHRRLRHYAGCRRLLFNLPWCTVRGRQRAKDHYGCRDTSVARNLRTDRTELLQGLCPCGAH